MTTDAIERIICKPIDEMKRFPMDEQTAETFIQLSTLPENFTIPEKEKPFLYALIEKRLEHCFSFKITDARLILVLAVISETPGSAIMYLWYLQYWCKRNDVRVLSFKQFCMDVFPYGFPLKSDLHKVWDDQKVLNPDSNRVYNLVDDNQSGLSVQFMTDETKTETAV